MIRTTLVIGGRANWGRARTFALAMKHDDKFELDIILIGSALIDDFGTTRADLAADGFESGYWEIPTHHVGDKHSDQARATADALQGLADYIDDRQPHCIITIADRFETISTAIAACFTNIPLVHVQGGEISGNIDNKVRWAISMMADIHFPSSDLAYDRLLQTLPANAVIYNTGCPAMDTVHNLTDTDVEKVAEKYQLSDEVAVICVHPNTEDSQEALDIYEALIGLISSKPAIHFVVLKPNIDAGNQMIRDKLDTIGTLPNISLFSGISPVEYACILRISRLLIGNSSSFIREGAALGRSTILLGDRQRGRDLEKNATICARLADLPTMFDERYGRVFEPSTRYGSGNAGIAMCDVLSKTFSTK